MIKGVIFDLDGTLIDSMGIWHTIDMKFLRENGIENPPENISDLMKKMTVEESSLYFIEKFGLNVTPEYVAGRVEELVSVEYQKNIGLKPYAEEILDFLRSRNIPCGVATVTYKSLAEAVLRRHGLLDRLSFILTDSEYPKGKNDSGIFLGAAELLGTKPSETAVIEDSLHCIETASGAGFFTVGVFDEASASDWEQISSSADRAFRSLKDIEKLF
ncbi:MAG: HAD family phosphatase [Oscillospiraceae bacterium]|nr:HAD family phosphatase [Oscillospiraceae bacterium]